MKKASNAPMASNKPLSSAGEIKELDMNDKGFFKKIIIYLVVGCVIIILMIYSCCKKRKSKSGYFYDESGNPEEKAKVVYIK